MSNGLKISGLKEVQRSLRAIAAAAPRVIAPALARAIKPVAARVAEEAPHDTGRLAASVEVLDAVPTSGRCHSEAVVPLEYGVHRDLGTRDSSADDFLERAFDEEGPRAANRATEEIARGLSR